MIKKSFLLILFLLPFIVWSQKQPSQFIFVEDDEKFEKKNGSGCLFYERTNVNYFQCEYINNCEGSFVEFVLSNCNPEGEDNEKYANEVLILNELEKLAEFNDCLTGKNLFFKIGEGIFIYKSDNIPYDSRQYYSKAYKLNINRFFEKFGSDLKRLFPDKKIFASNWGW